MNVQDIDTIAKQIATFAAKHINEGDQLEPMADIMVMGDDGPMRGAMPLGNIIGMANGQEIIKEAFAKLNVTQYVIAAEAWTIKRGRDDFKDKEDFIEATKNVHPSEEPDRIDSLIIAAQNNIGKNILRSYEIKTDENGNRSIDLDAPFMDMKWNDGDEDQQATGRFAGLLNVQKLH